MKIPKKIAKKFKKLKNLFPLIILYKTGWDRLRKRKKNLVPNSIHIQPGQENSEKIRGKKIKKLKILFSALVLAKTGWDTPKWWEKKILVWNSVHTQPEEENSEKNSKKIEKTKKPLFGIIFSQNRMR